MTDYIYVRVSTTRTQSTEAQETQLQQRFQDAHIITEVASGMKNRPELNKLVASLVAGDRLIVSALDRLGRKTSEVLVLIEDLDRRKITLISAREGIDYSTAMGRLVTQILVSVAEMERAMMSERTKVGLQNARNKGVRLGPPIGSRNKLGKKKKRSPEFIERFLRLEKSLTPIEMAVEFKISLMTVYRIIKELKIPGYRLAVSSKY